MRWIYLLTNLAYDLIEIACLAVFCLAIAAFAIAVG